MKKIVISILISVLFITACGTMFVKGGSEYRKGEEMLKKGRFDLAAKNAVAALEKNSEFEEASDLLGRSVEAGTEDAQARIEELRASEDPFVYDRIVPLYRLMDNLHQVISSSPYASKYETRSWEEKIQESMENAADAHYAAGQELLAKGDFRSARKATVQFEMVNKIIPEYKDVASLTEQATEAGIATAVVYLKEPGEERDLEGTAVNILSGDDSIKKFTRFLRTDELGMASGLSSSAALAQAKGSADFLIYVDNYTISGEVTPVSKSQAQTSVKSGFITMQFPATKVSASYELTASAPYAVYETASGKALQEDTISINAGNSVEYFVFNTDKTKSLEGGSYRSITMPEPDGKVIPREFFDDIAEQTAKLTITSPAVMRSKSFNIIADKVEGKTFFGNPEVIHVDNSFVTGVYYSYTQAREENKENADKAAKLLNDVIPTALEQNAQELIKNRDSAAMMVVRRAANTAKEALR